MCRNQSSANDCHNHQQNIFTSVLKRVAENKDVDGMLLYLLFFNKREYFSLYNLLLLSVLWMVVSA